MSNIIDSHTNPDGGKIVTYLDKQDTFDKDGVLIASVDPDGVDLLKKDEPVSDLMAETPEPVTPSGTPAFTGVAETGKTPVVEPDVKPEEPTA